MADTIVLTSIDTTPPRRHDGRVMRVSEDYARLRRLDHLLADDHGAALLVEHVCASLSVPMPRLRFHARRSPFTGACEAPRSRVEEVRRAAVHRGGRREDELAIAGSDHRRTSVESSEHGALRLGRSVTLMTLSHELAHHVVNHRDAIRTPAHGKVWVRRFDQVAAIIASIVDPDADDGAVTTPG
jgi:hypothetical protein